MACVEDSTAGERAGVRGPRGHLSPLTPALSPQPCPLRKSSRLWGEGAESAAPTVGTHTPFLHGETMVSRARYCGHVGGNVARAVGGRIDVSQLKNDPFACPHIPVGMSAISRWSSEATPPEHGSRPFPHPGGMPDVRLGVGFSHRSSSGVFCHPSGMGSSWQSSPGGVAPLDHRLWAATPAGWRSGPNPADSA